jgi:hypothetical protein
MKKIREFTDKYLPRVWGALMCLLITLLLTASAIGVIKLILNTIGVI